MSTITFTKRGETYPQYKKKMKSLGIGIPPALTLDEFKLSWNQAEYEEAKKACVQRLTDNINTTDDYLQYYADLVLNGQYEGAKAVTEVLFDKGIKTSLTHKYILPQ